MNLDLFTAALLALAGFSLGFRQIVLSPRNSTYPPAPPFVRLAMFVFAAAMAGAAVLFWGHANTPPEFAGQAAGIVAALSFGVAIYNAVMLVNILRQRYPAEVWRRLNRAADTVKRSCPDRKFAVPAPLHVPARR
jgi:hypothetical protein